MAPSLRAPRGQKTTEHLAVLRASDPCLSTLAPRQTLARPHELSYEPMERWAAMSKAGALRVPRGYKTSEHLEILRQSDPSYGTLAPKPRVREPVTLQQLSEMKECMKRNMSVDSFADPDETDALPELPRVQLAKMREWRLQRKASDGFDNESDRSAARTMERMSSQSVDSIDFDGAASGEWGDVPISPRLRETSPPDLKDKKAFELPPSAEHTGFIRPTDLRARSPSLKSALEGLSRRELQAVAKQRGVKANLKSSEIVDLLLPSPMAVPSQR